MITSGYGDGLIRRCFVFGDSLSVGSGADKPEDSYPRRIVRVKEWELASYAVGGTRLQDSAQIGQIRSLSFNERDIVLFLTGYNDMRAVGTTTSLQNAYINLLNEALDKFVANRATVYLGNCLKMKTGSYTIDAGAGFGNGSDTAVNQINIKIAQTASGKSGVTLVDVSSAFSPNTPGQVYSDNIHPSSAGYLTIANTFLSSIA